MKKRYILIFFLSILLFTSCKNKEKSFDKPVLTNMAGESSKDFVGHALKEKLDRGNVDKLLDWVEDFNKAVGEDKLVDEFSTNLNPPYDIGAMVDSYNKANKKYPQTNCRINTFLLLKDNIEVKKNMAMDDSLLFMDKEKIKEGSLFNKSEMNDFDRIFSRVKTKDSKDVKVHTEIMKKHLSNIDFPKDLHMVSVIIHDNLDGDYLFIGHVGVMVKTSGGYLFVEKISFEEPYQALVFAQKEDVYKYLNTKFKDYTDPNTARPFIMDNDKIVGWFKERKIMKIEHVAMYVKDLEKAREFFEKYFGARANDLYHNKKTNFKSYFLSFDEGVRLEIMTRDEVRDLKRTDYDKGFIHLALSVGSKNGVDRLTKSLENDGYEVISGPRITGDGYYESQIRGFEGNIFELTE